MRVTAFFGLISFCTIQPSFAAEAAVTLPPIVVQGAPSDALLYDPVVPAIAGDVRAQDPGGSAATQIEKELAVPVTDNGVPGVTSQLRVLGSSVQDTNVQTLGIPLNPPNGTGFDFASFPEFVWSRYDIRIGPSTGAFDSRGNVATFTLRPWTADALSSAKSSQLRVSQNFSWNVSPGDFLSQTSVAARQGPIAALAGYSRGTATGPTGAVSGEIVRTDAFRLQAHGLATSIEQDSPRSLLFSTTGQRTKTTRWIPVLQSDARLSRELRLKSSAFFDRQDIGYHDPGSGFSSFTRSEQYGIENALLWQDWTLGASARAIRFREEPSTDRAIETPTEGVFHLVARRSLALGPVLLDGSLAGDELTYTGWRPGASLGLRVELPEGLGVFARGSYGFNFPTPNDRLFIEPGVFVGNPELRPERLFTGILGLDGKGRGIESSLQAILVWKGDAQIPATLADGFTGTEINGGHSSELSLLHQLRVDLLSAWDLSNSLRLANSTVENTREGIPYDPGATEVVATAAHSPGDDPEAWRAGVGLRAVSRQASTTVGMPNPGYAFVDLNASYRLFGVILRGGIQNLLDRPIQVQRGYPWPGRIYSVGAVGEF